MKLKGEEKEVAMRTNYGILLPKSTFEDRTRSKENFHRNLSLEE